MTANAICVSQVAKEAANRACFVAADVCHQMLRDRPIHFVKLFCRMKEFLGDHLGQKRIKFEIDDLEHVIRRALNHGGRR